nr:hypothetical protein [Tanacetum cinerariifolium]
MRVTRNKEVLKSSTSKRANSLASDADHGDIDDGSSSSFEDLNFRGLTKEETKAEVSDTGMLGRSKSRELGSKNVVLAITEKIEIIRERLKAAQDRWKIYADSKRKPIEFNVGDFAMLKVLPWKGVFWFKNKGKLSPRFIRPFKILKQVGEVAYVLELPEEIRGIHNTFHASYLKKCLTGESSVITFSKRTGDKSMKEIKATSQQSDFIGESTMGAS